MSFFSCFLLIPCLFFDLPFWNWFTFLIWNYIQAFTLFLSFCAFPSVDVKLLILPSFHLYPFFPNQPLRFPLNPESVLLLNRSHSYDNDIMPTIVKQQAANNSVATESTSQHHSLASFNLSYFTTQDVYCHFLPSNFSF